MVMTAEMASTRERIPPGFLLCSFVLSSRRRRATSSCSSRYIICLARLPRPPIGAYIGHKHIYRFGGCWLIQGSSMTEKSGQGSRRERPGSLGTRRCDGHEKLSIPQVPCWLLCLLIFEKVFVSRQKYLQVWMNQTIIRMMKSLLMTMMTIMMLALMIIKYDDNRYDDVDDNDNNGDNHPCDDDKW